MQLNVDRALVVANTLRNSDFVNDAWCTTNPLWFMALRDEDIPEIHTKIWKDAKSQQFALYVKALAELEIDICKSNNSFLEHSTHSLLIKNETARTKFYRYLIAVLFTPGLRIVDTACHGAYAWTNEYFTGERFRALFEIAIDTNAVADIAKDDIRCFYPSVSVFSDTLSRLSIKLADVTVVSRLITDTTVSSLRNTNPAKFVYGINWSVEDRNNSFFYGKVLSV